MQSKILSNYILEELIHFECIVKQIKKVFESVKQTV